MPEGFGFVEPCWCSAQLNQANDITGLSLVREFLQYNLYILVQISYTMTNSRDQDFRASWAVPVIE